jgi:hypothetical protein
MSLVHPNSLSATLDAVNEELFLGRTIPRKEREEVALWIAGRQGQPGAYADMFAPTAEEMRTSIRLFTGEQAASSSAARHILGEETCRALILLKVSQGEVRAALERASEGMAQRLTSSRDAAAGMYCCARCTVALWRHLAVGGLPAVEGEKWLAAGMRTLKAHRDDDGRWRRFPFFWTLLGLSEIAARAAQAELRYAAGACERYLTRARASDRFAGRRRTLAERVLAGL